MRKKVDIIEVARHAGVSKSTVSRVVSDRGGSVSSRSLEKVNAAIGALGYTRNTMAAGLRTQRTWMVLVIVPDIANPFWSELARAVQDRLEAEGYSVVVGNTDWHEDREAGYYRLARSGRFDGLVVNTVTDDIAAILGLGIPAVMVGERAEGQDIDTVGTDSRAATRTALEHLWARGHRRIAIATSEHGGERYLSPRRRAYGDFLAEKGIPYDPSLSFSVNLSEEGGRERVDAVFCGNDVLAIAALEALRERGVEAGRDVSVIGMDDIPAAAYARPPLTTVRKSRARTGAAAAELLLGRIRDPLRPRERRLFRGELIERSSVAERIPAL